MGLLKHIRSRQKFSKYTNELQDYPKPPGVDRLTHVPPPILHRILSHVCPHAADETYEVSEESPTGSRCGLCDLGDMYSCALVNRTWYLGVQDVLYRSVRIDAVHFCGREEALAEIRRKKRIEPSSIVATRMRLFQRTAAARPDIASSVLFLKLPYMARETHVSDMTRMVSSLPNLRHVDLPDGFFSATPCMTVLRQELEVNCWDMRKMKYTAGAESAFEALASQPVWRSLEVLNLDGVGVDLTILRKVLASLPALNDVRMANLPHLTDAAFQPARHLPEFPSLGRLTLDTTPDVTSAGLVVYLSRPEVSSALRFLSLKDTGVQVESLHIVLEHAPNLFYLSITEGVERTFPLDPIPPLASRSLKTMNYEISRSERQVRSSPRITGPEGSFYAYLGSSIRLNCLPALEKLYVRKPDFADILIGAPHGTTRKASFCQPLEIFSKGAEDSDWVFSSVGAVEERARAASSHWSDMAVEARPVSAFLATRGAGPEWGGEARKSVMLGNGLGGFLAMPAFDGDRGGGGGGGHDVPAIPKAWEGALALGGTKA